ncbi:MAG: PAS domain S-box protein [Cytophagales bacterium]|nr:PAS domain S-box protein [Cytophagales bacterium]
MNLFAENLLIQSSPDGIAGFDRGMRITVWNPRMEQLFGLSRAAALGVPVDAPLLPRLLSGENGQVLAGALRGRSGTLRTVHLEKVGYTFYELTYFPLLREDGAVAGGMVMVKNIDPELAPGQLSSSNCLQFQGIFEKMADAFMALDAGWHITYVNRKGAAIFQRTPEDLTGKHLWTEFPGSVDHPFQRSCYRAVTENQPLTFEEYDGYQDIWFENRLYPLPDGLAIFFNDITRYKRAEAELKSLNTVLETRNAQLREAQRVAKIGNWEYTVATRWVYWSEEVFAIYGFSPAEPVPSAEQMITLYHPEDYAGYEPVAIRAFTHGEPYDTDVRIITPAGETKYVNIIARPVRDRDGNVDKVYGTVMDITDRKRAENTLQLRNEELQKINHQLDNFVYRAGHDLRAPLVSILGLIQIAQMEPAADQKDAYMLLMQRSVQKLDTFIQDIIHYSRNVRTEVKREPVNFRQLAAEVVENLQYMKTFPVDISVAADEPVPFHSDAKRLSVVLHNLVSNAIRYANRHRDHSWVRVALTTGADQSRITVADNGVGIGPEHLPRIFDMFYRATESSPGSGLGLYIVQEIVQTLGGSIRVESVPERGTTFTVCVPNGNC